VGFHLAAGYDEEFRGEGEGMCEGIWEVRNFCYTERRQPLEMNDSLI
jgi:hypothetical protein